MIKNGELAGKEGRNVWMKKISRRDCCYCEAEIIKRLKKRLKREF